MGHGDLVGVLLRRCYVVWMVKGSNPTMGTFCHWQTATIPASVERLTAQWMVEGSNPTMGTFCHWQTAT